jgi:hypothetical protein
VNYPTRVVSTGGRYHYRDDWETPDTQVISLDFESNKTMTWKSRSCNPNPNHGTMFYGEKGAMLLPSGNEYTVFDDSRAAKIVKKVAASDDGGASPDQLNTVGPGR